MVSHTRREGHHTSLDFLPGTSSPCSAADIIVHTYIHTYKHTLLFMKTCLTHSPPLCFQSLFSSMVTYARARTHTHTHTSTNTHTHKRLNVHESDLWLSDIPPVTVQPHGVPLWQALCNTGQSRTCLASAAGHRSVCGCRENQAFGKNIACM
jgi:hypothetical protein